MFSEPKTIIIQEMQNTILKMKNEACLTIFTILNYSASEPLSLPLPEPLPLPLPASLPLPLPE